jgi:hypothetical protein
MIAAIILAALAAFPGIPYGHSLLSASVACLAGAHLLGGA